MRRLVFAMLLAAACGPQPPTGEHTREGEFRAPPVARYEEVFRGVPANHKIARISTSDAVYAPASLELLAYQTPVRDQGERGLCTVFTSIALMEHLYLEAGMPDPAFSEQYLQWSVKVQLGEFPNIEGSNDAANLLAIHLFGVPPRALDPYDGHEWTAADDPACATGDGDGFVRPTECWTQGTPPAAALAAPKFSLGEGRFLNASDIKQHMSAKHTAVAVLVDFFFQAWNHPASSLPMSWADWRRGVVRYPNDADIEASHQRRSGHGVLIVGWDDELALPAIDADGNIVIGDDGSPVMERGFYIFKNSWGTSGFGRDNPYGAGYGLISERYVSEWGTAYVDDVPLYDRGDTR